MKMFDRITYPVKTGASGKHGQRKEVTVSGYVQDFTPTQVFVTRDVTHQLDILKR